MGTVLWTGCEHPERGVVSLERRPAAVPGREGVGTVNAEAKHTKSSRQIDGQVRRFDKLLKRSQGLLADRYGQDTATAMRQEMVVEFRQLIPDVPYIGGRGNVLSSHLTTAPQALAIYRVILRHGGSLEDTGELMHHMARVESERVPRVLRPWMVKIAYHPRRVKKAARRSQQRQYPDDFVFEFVEGDGKTFDGGMDMIECAYLKYLQAHGAEELCPYGCDCDYVTAEVLGYGLRRTKTLAWGCDKCDMRLTLGGTTTAPWPPTFAERTCGQTRATQDTGSSA